MSMASRVAPLASLLGLLLLAALFGYLVGRIVGTKLELSDPPITLRPDERPKVPVIQIHGVRDGAIRGEIQGEVRLFVGEDMVIPDGSGFFAIAPNFLRTEEITVAIPSEMQFVASRRGKYYYPVLSPQAQRLVPENRLYFRGEEEATAAGFLPWKR